VGGMGSSGVNVLTRLTGRRGVTERAEGLAREEGVGGRGKKGEEEKDRTNKRKVAGREREDEAYGRWGGGVF